MGVFTGIGDLLAQPNTPSDVRRGLLELAAETPGVTLRSGITDPLGQPGEGFTFEVKPSTETLIIDPDTGRLLATVGLTNGVGPHGPRTSAPRRRRRTPPLRRPRGQTPGIVITSLPTVCWFAKSVSAMAASDSAYVRLIATESFPSSIMEASMPR